MISKRLTSNSYGEPLLTVKVSGTFDVYRFAHHMEHGQCEFAEIGRNTKRSLKKRLGPKFYKRLRDYLHGGFS